MLVKLRPTAPLAADNVLPTCAFRAPLAAGNVPPIVEIQVFYSKVSVSMSGFQSETVERTLRFFFLRVWSVLFWRRRSSRRVLVTLSTCPKPGLKGGGWSGSQVVGRRVVGGWLVGGWWKVPNQPHDAMTTKISLPAFKRKVFANRPLII